MTAQLPHGLISVVSASHTEIQSSDPIDVIFERKKALYNFWKGLWHALLLLLVSSADTIQYMTPKVVPSRMPPISDAVSSSGESGGILACLSA